MNMNMHILIQMQAQLENYRHELDVELHQRKENHTQQQKLLKKRRTHLAKAEAEKDSLRQQVHSAVHNASVASYVIRLHCSIKEK